jgi:hypothetical protein
VPLWRTAAAAAVLWARTLAHIGADRAHDARGWGRIDCLPSQGFERREAASREKKAAHAISKMQLEGPQASAQNSEETFLGASR